MQFLISFSSEATTKSFTYFIVDDNWQIQELSTGAIRYFDLEIKLI